MIYLLRSLPPMERLFVLVFGVGGALVLYLSIQTVIAGAGNVPAAIADMRSVLVTRGLPK